MELHRTVAVVVVLLASMLCVCAQDLPMTDVTYHEDFEDGEDPFDFWVANGEYEVNFKGVTDERAFEGERSFKLDVTLKSGSYWYWHIPVHYPAEGELGFSGRILVTEGHDVRSGLGMNWQFPPTRHSGCGGFSWARGTSDGWKLIEGDIDAVGAQKADGVVTKYVAGGEGEYVGVYVDRIGIFIEGDPGTRVVLYVDDIHLEGRVVEDEAYQAEIDRRWQPFADRWQERLAAWRQRLEEVTARMAAAPQLPESLADAGEGITAALAQAREDLDELADVGYGRQTKIDEFEGHLRMAELAPATIEHLADAVDQGRRLATFTVPAISNVRILPTAAVVPGEPGVPLEISACRGEYEAASFVVLPLTDVQGLVVETEAAVGDAGTIPAERIDVKLVKVWYQAGRTIRDLDNRQLVPELLLNDSRLVRVDLDQRHNYLRSTPPEGEERYVLCSGETSDELDGVWPIEADTLQPADLHRLRPQQYWVTVHVPEDAAPGDYQADLKLVSEAGDEAVVPLRLHVHDFRLEPAPLIYAIYYDGKLYEKNEPTITSRLRSEEQYRAEIEDMKAHGVLYPTVYQSSTEARLPRALEIRAEVGLPTDHMFAEGAMTGSPQTDEAIERLREKARLWVGMAERFGYDNLYMYGIDEAKGERLAAQRRAWKAVHEEGGKIFVACYYGTFEAMGDLLDVAVLAGRPDPDEAAKFHSVGNMAFTYAYPQVGPEEPETFRRNFGLVLWQADFDGAMDYAYQRDFEHVWNDFDDDRYRDHNFTYPTAHGVIDTVQWEGFREAVDDTRYMATLLAAMEDCEDAGVRAAAQQWVDTLDPNRNLYEVRAEMVGHINRCLQAR